MRICLFEDRRVDELYPLTATRPTFDLLCGLTTLEDKQRRYFKAGGVGYVVRPAVAELLRQRHPSAPVNDPVWLRCGPVAVVNARWVPPAASDFGAPREPFLAVCRGDFAFVAVTPDCLPGITPATLDDALDDWFTTLPRVEVGGFVVRYPWDLVERNGESIVSDFNALCDPTELGFHPSAFGLVGPADRLYIDPTAVVEPHVVADTTKGPVVIGPHAVVTAFSRLEGPCVVGRYAQVFGAKIRGGTTIGPHCRVGGEIEASVLLGYVNKYHDGFLGHSYVGEWVNIAAGTQTADLQCDYSPVSVRIGGRRTGTGLRKVGSFFGDHAKTGIGALLNCGTVIGPFAAVLPTGRLAPREVPAFMRVGPSGLVPQPSVDELLETAATVMQRRGQSLTKPLEGLYRSLAAGESALLVA
jgi:UDP-N-acetylglucosamine diphosphorylase/glucosamine-1-phosphate N-acetyltransferase